ncbi:hypothetical protein Htur_3974 (plasmid) [Haloterrigena turkmenica DSM 5511]|uniref:Uncharacterized protein n=1 Tax=Haloterrigena turkmenica (strain ATCC 51198 / DSM 5511 / JCM 9101 / NCIMB 13204 / VKM B-1734 / 4k) TaxID=543526 RepID=D2S0C8_HALTV|nr:hypothetical protein [Haloterrigena turkmenica]ADB62825.1 hypothetical protein Htur_3974 [Haloterrigena turkmenica DSM 5511]
MSLSLYAALGDTLKYVSTETNIPDQLTPVLSISPKDGVGVLIRNAVSVGDKIGLPIYGKFRDSNGNLLPEHSSRARLPGTDRREHPGRLGSEGHDRELHQEQRLRPAGRSEGRRRQAPAQGQKLEVRDIDEAHILVDSSEQIDHVQSEIYFEETALAEMNLE